LGATHDFVDRQESRDRDSAQACGSKPHEGSFTSSGTPAAIAIYPDNSKYPASRYTAPGISGSVRPEYVRSSGAIRRWIVDVSWRDLLPAVVMPGARFLRVGRPPSRLGHIGHHGYGD
jgi:hypothetical protein